MVVCIIDMSDESVCFGAIQRSFKRVRVLFVWPIKDVSLGRRLMYGIQVERIKQQSERPNLTPGEETK